MCNQLILISIREDIEIPGLKRFKLPLAPGSGGISNLEGARASAGARGVTTWNVVTRGPDGTEGEAWLLLANASPVCLIAAADLLGLGAIKLGFGSRRHAHSSRLEFGD
jgi:hypothetical protein